MQKKIKGRSKKPGDAFLTVDASIYNHLAAAIRKAGNVRFNATAPNKRDPMKKIIQGLLNQLVSKDKKQTVPQAKRRISTAFKKHQGLSDIAPDQMDPIIAVLQDYGLVRPGGTTTKPTRKKKPAGKKPAAKKSVPKKKPAGKKRKAGDLKMGADGFDFGTTPPGTPGQPKRKAKGPSGRQPGGSQSFEQPRRMEEEQETEKLNEVFKRWAVMADIKEKK